MIITIKTQNGKITDGRNELAEQIHGLPNGSHIVLIYQDGDAIAEISRVSEWLYSLPADYNDIQNVQHMMNRLSAAIFRYTANMAQSYKEATRYEVMSKTQYTRRKFELKQNGTNVRAAEIQAKKEVIELEEAAQITGTQKDVMNIQYKAASSTLQTLVMMRSMLSKEKSSYEQTKGDSFPTQQ